MNRLRDLSETSGVVVKLPTGFETIDVSTFGR